MIWLITLVVFSVHAQTPDLKAAPAEVVPTGSAEKAKGEKDSSDYEVDYEEESGTEDVEVPEEEKPVPVKSRKNQNKKNSKESLLQGSRAEKKIAPLMKSETKSIYKKNGKALDVDSD